MITAEFPVLLHLVANPLGTIIQEGTKIALDPKTAIEDLGNKVKNEASAIAQFGADLVTGPIDGVAALGNAVKNGFFSDLHRLFKDLEIIPSEDVVKFLCTQE